MTNRLAVLAIHGMGNIGPSFAEPMINRLIEELGPLAGNLAFETCYWAPLLQRQQDVTWERLLTSGNMSQHSARRWIVSALGDPVSYLSGYLGKDAPAYDAVHECMRAALERLERRVIPDAPLVILAHSLGGVIASNYLWNEQRASGTVQPAKELTPLTAPGSGKRSAIGRTPFQRLERLTTLITYGCNIPLFLPPAPPIECVAFPPPQLPDDWKALSRWLNVYDPDDLLGYPIAGIWDDAKGTSIDDVPLEVGPWPVGETPFVHSFYDRSTGFIQLIAEELRGLSTPAP